jgi:succinyl-CoA synthetase beta subunit
VRVVRSREELDEAVPAILGLTIKGKPVRAILLEQGASVLREFYLAVTLDRHAKSPLVIFSSRGGVDIEQVAADDPAALLRLPLDAASEACDDTCRSVVEAAELGAPGLDEQLADMVRRLWALYRDCDAALLEVNPLAVVDGPVRLVALDAKVTIDDNALYRQPDLAAQRPDEDARERAAREAGVTYLSLDGNVGVLGNGAGLVMSTLDMIGAAGGTAADFCDIGGGARAERIAAALDIITSDDRVRALLINIFGGITRGDEVARGVLAWGAGTSSDLPLVVRLDGNNAAEGLRLLAEAGLGGLVVTQSAQEAVEAVVSAAADREPT